MSELVRMRVYGGARWMLWGMGVVFVLGAIGLVFFLGAAPRHVVREDQTPVFLFSILQMLVFGGAFFWAGRRREVVIGTDGVLGERIPYGEAFVGHADFDEAVLTDDRVVELRRDGETVLKLDHAQSPALLEREISLARERFETREHAPRPEGWVEGGGELARWVEELAQRTRRGEYRGKPLTPEALLRVAQDPGYAPRERVVAAVVAARTGDERTRRRVRELASGAACSAFVEAFEEASRGRIDEAALRRIDALRPKR